MSSKYVYIKKNWLRRKRGISRSIIGSTIGSSRNEEPDIYMIWQISSTTTVNEKSDTAYNKVLKLSYNTKNFEEGMCGVHIWCIK